MPVISPSPGLPTRVLVSCCLTSDVAPAEISYAVRSLAERVVAQLATVDVRGILVDAANSALRTPDQLNGCAGLIVLGGSDVHPGKYGECEIHPCTYGANPIADEFEITLVRRAASIGMPVLGICRGMQILNVAFGGNLHQDIDQGSTVHRVLGRGVLFNSHPVRVKPGTHLAAIYGSHSLEIQSSHHQAVARIGADLRVSATADDGVVEAIELADGAWGLGVQWHPEAPEAELRQFDLLVSEFARQCGYFLSSIAATVR